MILYVNGDSNSYGYEAGGPDNTYGRWLADHLGYNFVCEAEPSCSNHRILRTTKEFLSHTIPDLIIIGWTDWQREEVPFKDSYVTFNASGLSSIPEELQAQYKQWVIEQDAKIQEKSEFWHDQIWSFHNDLLDQGIPHLFFGCYQSFKDVREHLRKPWGNNYIAPYGSLECYWHWLKRQGFETVTPKFGHFGKEAHIAWARRLLPLLTNIK